LNFKFKNIKNDLKTKKFQKMQNKLSYSHPKVHKTNLWHDEHRTLSFGKQCKVHRNPCSPNYKYNIIIYAMCARIFYFIFTIDVHTKYHNLRMRRLRRKKKRTINNNNTTSRYTYYLHRYALKTHCSGLLLIFYTLVIEYEFIIHACTADVREKF